MRAAASGCRLRPSGEAEPCSELPLDERKTTPYDQRAAGYNFRSSQLASDPAAMLRKTLLTIGALLIAAAVLCLAVTAIGLGRIMLHMPPVNAAIQEFRSLQFWSYGCVASFLLAFVVLWFVRDPQPAEGKS